jgi:hypothetical protein
MAPNRVVRRFYRETTMLWEIISDVICIPRVGW